MLQELASLLDSDSEIAILACQLRFQFAIDPQFQAGKKEMDEASKWLVRACELGSKFHRGLAFRFHQVFDQPIPEKIAIEWLEDAAADGSSIAIESLQTHFPNRLLRLRQGLDSTFKIRAGCNLEHRGIVDLNPESPHLGTVPPTDHGTEFDQLFATINITTDMNQVNENARFLLEHCRNGNYTECKRLLEKGVLVLHNDNSPSALHWLVSFQNEEQMEDIAVRLLGNGAVLNHWEDMDNVDILNGDIRGTPLHWAVWQRNTSAVRVLTKLDPDPQSENVDRAVLLAATLHFPDVLELLQHWITARRTSSYNVFPAVIMACMTGPFLIPRLLHRDSHCREADMLKAFCCLLTMGNLSKEERSSIVMCTILHNNSILLRYLLENLIPKERQDMIDTFWLYFVIEAGFYEAFEVLTEANIGLPHMNINALAGPALTALQVCAVTHQRNLAFATRLIEMGWPADARTPEVYYTPFCIALMNGMYDYANLLLQRGANKDILLGIGHGGRKTPAFILLTIWPETPISRLKYLLEYLPNHGYGHINFIGFPGLGANLLYPVAFNIWASYRSGRHMAEILKYILSMLHDRSCLNSLDRLGVSVIGIAAINGSAECCRILIEAGADVNAGLSRPLSSAQKRLKALRDEEQLNSGAGLAGERKLAADRCARAEETINLLERHGAQGNNFIGFNVNLWEKIAQGKFRPPSAEVDFFIMYGCCSGDLC